MVSMPAVTTNVPAQLTNRPSKPALDARCPHSKIGPVLPPSPPDIHYFHSACQDALTRGDAVPDVTHTRVQLRDRCQPMSGMKPIDGMFSEPMRRPSFTHGTSGHLKGLKPTQWVRGQNNALQRGWNARCENASSSTMQSGENVCSS